MTVLVNRLAPEAEIPVDHLDRAVRHQLLQSRLLGDLSARGPRGRLAGFEVPLGKSPVLVRVANQQEPDLTVRSATKHDAARARLSLGAGLSLAGLRAATSHRKAKCEMWNAKFLTRASYPTNAHELALTFRISHSAFRIC